MILLVYYNIIILWDQWRTEGVVWGVQTPPRNTKLQLSPEPLTRGPLPADPRSLCPLSSAEFVEPPHRTKFLGTPLYGTTVVYAVRR
jgi:hypothetical protein